RAGLGALPGLLRDHLTPLFLKAAILEPAAEAAHSPRREAARSLGRGREHAPERELRREDDRRCDEREDHDERTGAVQVLGQPGVEPHSDPAAGAIGRGAYRRAAEGEAEKRARAAEKEHGPDELRIRRVERLAPEVMPADYGNDRGNQIRAVADELKGQLRQERPDAANEVRRRMRGF